MKQRNMEPAVLTPRALADTQGVPTTAITGSDEQTGSLVFDAAGLAAYLGASPRQIKDLAAAHAWLDGALPPPTYVGNSVASRNGSGRRWRRVTVDAWLAARGWRW